MQLVRSSVPGVEWTDQPADCMTGRLRTLEEIGDGWERAVDFVEMCRAQAWCLDVDADAAIVALLRLYKATAADKFRAV